jgi:hypothetical protein
VASTLTVHVPGEVSTGVVHLGPVGAALAVQPGGEVRVEIRAGGARQLGLDVGEREHARHAGADQRDDRVEHRLARVEDLELAKEDHRPGPVGVAVEGGQRG